MIWLWFLHSSSPLKALYHCIKFHLFIFNTFGDMLWTSLLLQKLRMEITVITCNRVTVFALCTTSDGHLSMYQVSYNSLLYFQRYALDKLFIAKIKKESNSINTGDRVMVLAFCNSPHGPLSVYHFIKLPFTLLEICSREKWDGWTKRRLYALPLGSIKISAIRCLLN